MFEVWRYIGVDAIGSELLVPKQLAKANDLFEEEAHVALYIQPRAQIAPVCGFDHVIALPAHGLSLLPT